MNITDIEGIDTQITDFDNFFGIYEDKRGNYSFNLNETMYLNIGENKLKEYVCNTECYWPLISYKLYRTPRLSWLLMKINKVKANEMFNKKNPGDVVKYLPIETVNYILERLDGS